LLGLVIMARFTDLFKTKDASYSIEPLFLLMFFLGLLILRGIPPFIGFFLKVMILKFLIFKKFVISLFLLILSLGLIFTYLIIRFYLLTSFIIFTAIKSSGTPQQYLIVDLLLFNTLIRLIFLNTMFCKYYISNETKLQSLKW
jgi:formate hydrogenlyase subunit 3/multisubunit Na+/H+ antiporter MnhD subunit